MYLENKNKTKEIKYSGQSEKEKTDIVFVT